MTKIRIIHLLGSGHDVTVKVIKKNQFIKTWERSNNSSVITL